MDEPYRVSNDKWALSELNFNLFPQPDLTYYLITLWHDWPCICIIHREHPLMKSDIRVGRGVQDGPKRRTKGGFLAIFKRSLNLESNLWSVNFFQKNEQIWFDLFSWRVKKQTNQIRPFVFWKKLGDHKLLLRLSDL